MAEIKMAKDIAETLEIRLGIPQDWGSRIVTEVFESIREELIKGNAVLIRSFGKFEARPMKSVRKYSAFTGKQEVSQRQRKLAFSPTMKMKEDLNVNDRVW